MNYGKKQIYAILLHEFKLGCKVTETANSKYQTCFWPRLANAVQYWF